MPGKAPSNLSDASAVIYVRVDPDTKARLRGLADRAFNGSMAAAIRYLLETQITGRLSPTWGPDLDED